MAGRQVIGERGRRTVIEPIEKEALSEKKEGRKGEWETEAKFEEEKFHMETRQVQSVECKVHIAEDR